MSVCLSGNSSIFYRPIGSKVVITIVSSVVYSRFPLSLVHHMRVMIDIMVISFADDEERHLIQRAARERAAIVARYDLVSLILFLNGARCKSLLCYQNRYS